MKNKKLKMLIRTCSILTSIAVFTVFATSSYAEDSVESLEGTTSNLQNELSDLNSELDALSGELDTIMKKMDTTTAEIEQVKADLAVAKGEEAAQYQSMKLRIKHIYESGNTCYLEMLFSSASMSEFLNQAEFISAVSEYDRNRLKELVDAQNAVAEKEKQLQTEQSQLTKLQDELNQKQADLTAKISSTSGELEQYSAKLAEAKERAKAAQEALDKEVTPVEPETPSVTPPSDNDNSDSSQNQTPDVSASELEIFAALIECEAGSTDYDGMLAVASVVMNRVNHRYYPDTITGVIYQSGQFSPVASGKLDKVLKRGIKSSCLEVAKDAIAGKNNVGDCLNFRAASSGHSGIVIGGNVFF